ncbi:MAG: [FeFe] hydrogenase H-cluster maturation GTPase HydF [Oscillospiraceae bacterium]|nr:[FeFe] hydrogenase H-cluster maturation GTPase HydF [Oscillospiraceae bacterium]
MNSSPKSHRVHIGFFGRRNVGKSSVVNAFTNQNLAVVSNVLGTTTDPVYKAMELLPMGPVMIIDTPGIDDKGELGDLRVEKTKQVLRKIDVAVLVVDSTKGLTDYDNDLIALFKDRNIPFVVAYNKDDLCKAPRSKDLKENEIAVSALNKTGINSLREMVARLTTDKAIDKKIIGDLLDSGDIVLLVIPIDSSAPKGRLILPQQQVIRDVLDSNGTVVICKENEIEQTINNLSKKPRVVVTDSQAFEKANKGTPKDIYLTSFSILMARFKGFLETAVKGAKEISRLKDGDKILIAEGCTHHRQCEDIGSVKIPRWLSEYTNKNLDITLVSGTEYPEDLSPYSLVIHCGGCMLNEKEMQYRMNHTTEQGVPFTNYGTAIAYMQGILKRSIEFIPEVKGILD